MRTENYSGGRLSHRSLAVYLSQVQGWNTVPHTHLRNGRLCEGVVHPGMWTDPEQSAVDLVPADGVPDIGWKEVIQKQDENRRISSPIQEDARLSIDGRV